MTQPLTEDDLHELYLWVDGIPLSRPKKNIARDFSDGCCVAEVLKYFFPKLVDLHNYTPAMSIKQKTDNWVTLNSRVFRKLHFEVPQEEVSDITAAVPGAIERFLRALRIKISQIKARREEIGSASADFRYEASLSPAQHYPRPFQQRKQRSESENVHRNENELAARQPCANSASVCRSPSLVKELPNNPVSSRLLLEEKDRTIFELRETVSLLSEKVAKLEELVRVKDEKLSAYRATMGRI